jgi:hypothetical protein
MPARIIQPQGVNYMIEKTHHTKELAEQYVEMLISKMEKYITLKRQGKRIAPLMTLEQMETQLANMKQFTIEEFTR